MSSALAVLIVLGIAARSLMAHAELQAATIEEVEHQEAPQFDDIELSLDEYDKDFLFSDGMSIDEHYEETLGIGRQLLQHVYDADSKIDILPCPIGFYRRRVSSSEELSRFGGQRVDGCIECPRGKYGETTGLTKSDCTADCPRGTYNDFEGRKSEADCRYCPQGRYGETKGMTESYCTGHCPVGWYSDEIGLTRDEDCKVCPHGYRGWQCTWTVEPMLGKADEY